MSGDESENGEQGQAGAIFKKLINLIKLLIFRCNAVFDGGSHALSQWFCAYLCNANKRLPAVRDFVLSVACMHRPMGTMHTNRS